MNILAVESSAVAAGAAVVGDGVLKSEAFAMNGLTHSQTLMVLIDEAIKSAGLKIGDIDRFAVSTGPGSFTGLRIGVGTVKGLALATEKPAAGISSLLGLAYNVSAYSGIVCPIMDARRGEVYNALYFSQNGMMTEIAPMRAIPAEELAKELSGKEVMFVGDGVPKHRELLENILGDKALFAPAHLLYQRASGIAMASLKAEFKTGEELLPVYIRKPQAEREYEERNGYKL